jgi:hypothetical protein
MSERGSKAYQIEDIWRSYAHNYMTTNADSHQATLLGMSQTYKLRMASRSRTAEYFLGTDGPRNHCECVTVIENKEKK